MLCPGVKLAATLYLVARLRESYGGGDLKFSANADL